MDINLKYGKGNIAITVPSTAVIPEYTEPDYAISREGFTSDLGKFLPADRNSYFNVAVVVSDKTRLCGYPLYLPWLTDILIKKGASKENITFYIAYGTHACQTEQESIDSYGEIYSRFTFKHHDCNDVSLFETLGTTKRGTPVVFRKDILASTLVITFGSISHHYFAGYGGGRKMLFPGLASRMAVYNNHGLFLDKQARCLSAGCQPGVLEGNPLAEDLREIDTHAPAKISIHGILNASGKVCRLMIGNSYGDFLKACEVHDSFYRYSGTGQFDLVVASGGGYPKDINFIQSHKSVHHAAAFVKDGGNLVVLADCIDGIGSNYFMKYLEAGSFVAAFAMLENNYEGNGGTALSMLTKIKRIKISLITSLDENTCRTLGVKKINSGHLQNMVNDEKGTIAVIRNASMLVK
jgi:nickel-dependent lactate racemase